MLAHVIPCARALAAEEHLEEQPDAAGVDYRPPRVGVFIGSFRSEEAQGRARGVVTSHPTAATSRVYSFSVSLFGSRRRRPWKQQGDQELVFRGTDGTRVLCNYKIYTVGGSVRYESHSFNVTLLSSFHVA